MAFSLFHKKKAGQPVHMDYHGTPVIRCSICTGEQVAGFRNPDGHIEEVMLLRTPEELEQFRKRYGITGEIEKIY